MSELKQAAWSPKRIGRGIRSSYLVERENPWTHSATVTEIAVPDHVVIDGVTGTLRAVWSRV